MANSQKPGTGATNKRRRELAAAKLERQTARRTQKAAVRRRRRIIGWSAFAVVAAAAVAIVVMWPFTGSDSTATPTPSATPTGNVDIGCDPAPLPESSAAPPSWKTAPEDQLVKGTDYTLTLETNCGKIVIATDSKAAPTTVNSQLWLAQQGFFDATPCPRVTTSGLYVLQCGDPLGTGGGNAGYTIPDENLPKAGDDNYPKGTVAMANGGANTSSSQFFIVYKDTTLPASYSIWGKVTQGLDVVEKVAAAGVVGGGTDGEPAGSIGIVTAVPHPKLG